MKKRKHTQAWTSFHTAACLVMAVLSGSCSDKDAEYDATGTFEATEVTVSAQVTGELLRLTVEEGQTVASGTVVGNIDVRQLQLKRDEIVSAQRQLASGKQQMAANKRQLGAGKEAVDSRTLDLRKQLAVIEQQIANQQRERHRFGELVADGAAPQKQVDDIDAQIRVLERQKEATRDQIASANESADKQSRGIVAQMEGVDAQMEGVDAQQTGMASQRAQIEDQIAKANIKSPVAGTVLAKYAEQGEYVAVGKPLFRVADTRNMFLRAYVTSTQLSWVKIGQKVTVFADYGNGEKKEYEGRIAWISDKSEFTPKTIVTDDERADLVYAVKVAVRNDGNIKIGMYGELKL